MQLKNLIKNSLLSIFLLSMSALVSAQENVLSETWGQKLDLTIPSLEMQSTSVLDSKAKQEIMMGWTCCYRNELINAVQMEASQKSIGYLSKANQKRFEYIHRYDLVDPPTTADWSLFVLLQIADVYTTSRGLKYKCVKEINPFIGNRPSIKQMTYTKVAVLVPAFQIDINRGELTRKSMRSVNTIMSLVVMNNYEVWQKAEKYCEKI